MEMNNKNCGSCKKSRCTTSWIVWILIIVGGLNWGLTGIGMFAGGDWNVVRLIFGGAMWLEAIIYILVGLAAVMSIFGGCKCKKCKSCQCDSDGSHGKDMNGGMNMDKGAM